MDVPDADVTRPPLADDRSADVCVVGAGIAGLSVAYECARAGMSVTVLDDGPVGGGETCRTTAHLASALDDRFTHLEFLFGKEGSRLAAESHAAAIDRIEEIVREENIDCGFARLDGYLFAGPETTKEDLTKEWDAALRAGLEATLLDATPLPAHGDVPCIRFGKQAHFHPMRYLAALASSIERMGGTIHCGSHARDMAGGADAHVTTADGKTVRAKHVVVATNSPVNDRFAMHTKQAPYRSYAIALDMPAGAVAPALWWDDQEHYHYVRVWNDGERELLIVGGEDHKTGQANDAQLRYQRLEQWARARFPMAGAVAERWSGQVYEPADSLAFIGRNPVGDGNVYIVTGDSGHGMTHGAIAGMLIRDLIAGTENPWTGSYDPARKTPQAAMEYLKENMNVAKEYCDLVTPGDVSSPDDVKPGTGAVMRKGLTKIALYRDDAGTLHARSAICPHLGCVVGWNSEEKTWDCPCHGSRFRCTGEVVNGPAAAGLDRAPE